MIGKMTRRVHRFDAPIFTFDNGTVADNFIGRISIIRAFIEGWCVMFFIAHRMRAKS